MSTMSLKIKVLSTNFIIPQAQILGPCSEPQSPRFGNCEIDFVYSSLPKG